MTLEGVTRRRCLMAPFIIMIVLSIGLMALFGIAGGSGIDSRPSYGDDHAR